jgi:hypothetical protein
MSQPFRRIAQILWWASLVLILAGLLLYLLPVLAIVPADILMGGGIVLLGANILMGGDIIVGPEPRRFSARGQVVRGVFRAGVGLSDLLVGAGPNDRIAVIRSGPLGSPFFRVEEGVAYLQVGRPPLEPNLARWQAGLATNMLWDIEARSSLGHLRLNLYQLRLETVRASTSMGSLHVICPGRGFTEITLQTAIGQVTVTLPPDVEADVQVDEGTLARVLVRNDRLIAQGGGRYTTPPVEQAAARVAIRVRTAAGDVLLN